MLTGRHTRSLLTLLPWLAAAAHGHDYSSEFCMDARIATQAPMLIQLKGGLQKVQGLDPEAEWLPQAGPLAKDADVEPVSPAAAAVSAASNGSVSASKAPSRSVGEALRRGAGTVASLLSLSARARRAARIEMASGMDFDLNSIITICVLVFVCLVLLFFYWGGTRKQLVKDPEGAMLTTAHRVLREADQQLPQTSSGHQDPYETHLRRLAAPCC
mmetsp:Transcript_79578/g.202777  ORF Transcript_79578/g.202777 Transcript_79578/m.202777 type:complete len:215 (+) Transcript_79578:90-734(+)